MYNSNELESYINSQQSAPTIPQSNSTRQSSRSSSEFGSSPNAQQSTSSPSLLPSVSDGGIALTMVLFASGVAIFIVWLWSMLSMISLNMRFKEFYEEHSSGGQDSAPRDVDESWLSINRNLISIVSLILVVAALLLMVFIFRDQIF